MRLRSSLGPLLAVAMIASACDSADDKHSDAASTTKAAASVVSATPVAPKGTWVGTIDGTNALVAVVSDGLEVTAYTCDSAKVSSWFRGLASGGRPHLLDGKGGALDAVLAADRATGRFTNANGKHFAFTAASTLRNVLFRADAAIAGAPLVGGWILGPGGEQRGAVALGPSQVAAPVLKTAASPQLVRVDLGTRNADIVASVIAPRELAVTTRNTTGFEEFVIAGFGDSYSAGEGNPTKPANLSVGSTFTAWDKLAAGGVVLGPLVGTLGPIGAAVAILGVPGLLALAAAAHVGGESGMPEVTGIGEPTVEQWGGVGSAKTAPPDEAYRLLCHRGKGPEEKVFERLAADPAYSAIHFVFYNFACAGSQTRHLFSASYDGNPDRRSTLTPNQIPPQLAQLQAFLGDDSTATSTARTFLTNKHVPFLQLPTSTGAVPHVDALYFSSGGNDLGFGDVINRCAIFPLPDCGDGTNGTTNQAQRVQQGGDGNIANALSPDANLGHDNVYPGLGSLPASYAAFDAALRNARISRSGQTLSVTPSVVYVAEGPNPLEKSATTRCNGSEGALHNDLIGLLSPTDVTFANKMANDLDDALDAGANAANAAPLGDGRDRWTVVPNRHAFVGHALCQTSRFVQTGADALRTTGNDLGVDGILEASDGTMHPNDQGYEVLADNLEPLMRRQLDDMLAAAPAQPARLREVRAVQGREIELRWDDKANNDFFTQVLTRRAGTTGAFSNLRTLGVDATSFTVPATQPTTNEYEIKVCTRFGQCTVSAPIVATNEAPSVPTGLAGSATLHPLTKLATGLSVTWTPVLKNLSVSVVIRAQVTGSDTVGEFRVDGVGEPPVRQFTLDHAVTPTSTTASFPNGTYTVRVRGCNVFGCTETSNDVSVATVGISVPSTLVPPRITGPDGSALPPTTRLG